MKKNSFVNLWPKCKKYNQLTIMYSVLRSSNNYKSSIQSIQWQCRVPTYIPNKRITTKGISNISYYKVISNLHHSPVASKVKTQHDYLMCYEHALCINRGPNISEVEIAKPKLHKIQYIVAVPFASVHPFENGIRATYTCPVFFILRFSMAGLYRIDFGYTFWYGTWEWLKLKCKQVNI